jgi:serine acetyltransferase
MFDNLRADFARVRWDRRRTIAETGWGRSVFLQNIRVLLSLTIWSVIAYRFSHWVYKLRVPVIKQILNVVALVFQRWVELWTACHLFREAEIGPGLLAASPFSEWNDPTSTRRLSGHATGTRRAGCGAGCI